MVSNLRKKMVGSVTNREIARYWKQKRMVEEDHFYAALKAAACLRPHNISVTNYDYFQFEDFIMEEDEGKDSENSSKVLGQKYENSKEIRVGIKNWWTKSKYAYLNQPANNNPRKRSYSTYLPNFFLISSKAA